MRFTFPLVVPLLILVSAPIAHPRAAETATGVVSAADIDFTACRAFVDGKLQPSGPQGAVLATLGLKEGSSWEVGNDQEGQTREYIIAFKQEVAIGSVLFQHGGRLGLLKAGAEVPNEAGKDDVWTELQFPDGQSAWRLTTLPAGTTSRAFRCILKKQWGHWHRFDLLRVFPQRYHNLVPDALANGEAEYISYADLRAPIPYLASNITWGCGAWQSHGPDQNKRIPRAPVSDVAPTWFVVSWDEPQTFSRVVLHSNFRDVTLLSYQGPPGINPAVGSDADWKKIKCAPKNEGGTLWFSFEPIKTRGLKFVGTDTGERFGRIDGLHVWTDLAQAPVPPRQSVSNVAPFKIALSLPFDAEFLSMAVDDAGDHRVRNMLRRISRKAGESTEGWDLKNEDGTFVQPGKYRWKAIASPGLQLRYEMTPYPNIETNAPENSPWLNGASGPGGWLADHSAPSAACAAGDRIFLSSPCAESGVALIECDLQGHKLWGHHNLMAWTGPGIMASDGKALYAAPWANGTDRIWRFTLPEKKLDTFLEVGSSADRRRGIKGLAVRDGKLYASVRSGLSVFENATTLDDVDLDTCLPRYAVPRKGGKIDEPDPRSDFTRLFRLNGTPSGCNGLIWLESPKSPAPRQHILLALHKPMAVGTLVFPMPEDEALTLRLSVLKPDAPYPPRVRKESDWIEIFKGKGKGWMAIPAPEHTLTRALRIGFDHGSDELDEVLNQDTDLAAKDDLFGKDEFKESKNAWQARIEGMKILANRFTNLFPSCKVRVNSGTVTPEGEWDAQRTRPLTRDNPGIYQMEWAEPQTIRGLAIKEIDGHWTEIDAWTGDGPPDMNAKAGWEKISFYEQPTRYYYNPDQMHNSRARYIDGYLDFGKDVKTRALRLRVIEQWMWKEDDRGGCAGVRKDRGGEKLEPARCRVYGIAPLQALGGEARKDPLICERLEVYDTATKKLLKEVHLESAGDLALAPDGTLYAVSGEKVVKVDVEGGKHTPLNLPVKEPRAIACDKAGNLYVFDMAPERRVIEVFDPSGKPLRTIGTPGGRVTGPWDPSRFASHPGVAVDLAVDQQDQLWVVECDFTPKRVSLWGTDGTFKKDFFGNTSYGGGGCLDPYDKSRLFYGAMEFALDWKSGATCLKNITWLGDSPAGEVPIQVKDRLYLVTRPTFTTESVGVVYLYENGRSKRVAAVGAAGRFPPLRVPEILEKLGQKAIGYHDFAWSDRNGDGKPQADEVEFFETSDGRGGAVYRFEETLSVDGTNRRFEVKEYLPNGAPVYEGRKKLVERSGCYRTEKGSFFLIGAEHMGALDAEGKPMWTHPSEGWGVHALYSAKPYFPGQTVAQFGIAGHETATKGDLGEFFVTHSNTGAWHIWTADGLLAGRIFRDMRGPGARPWSMREHDRGMDLSDITTGQEHFSAYFCRSRADDRYYMVAGHNHVSVVEVAGIEKFKRLGGELNVTPEDVQQAIEWDRKMQARRIYEAAKLIECRRAASEIKIDGEPGEWDFESARLPDRDVSFAMTYDDSNLYLMYQAKDLGPIKNTGNDWKRLFKTGAAVDLQIGLDGTAPADRKTPVAGDSRLLMTLVDGRPTAVLYQPNAPGAPAEAKWETHTQVFKADFDRVVQLPGVKMAAKEMGDRQDGYVVEIAVPLAELGLKLRPDLRLKLDWGVLVSGPDGNETFQRLYWANQQTAIVSDEAAEAQLQPELWGYVRFSGKVGKNGVSVDSGAGKVLRTQRTGTNEGIDDLKLDEE